VAASVTDLHMQHVVVPIQHLVPHEYVLQHTVALNKLHNLHEHSITHVMSLRSGPHGPALPTLPMLQAEASPRVAHLVLRLHHSTR